MIQPLNSCTYPTNFDFYHWNFYVTLIVCFKKSTPYLTGSISYLFFKNSITPESMNHLPNTFLFEIFIFLKDFWKVFIILVKFLLIHRISDIILHFLFQCNVSIFLYLAKFSLHIRSYFLSFQHAIRNWWFFVNFKKVFRVTFGLKSILYINTLLLAEAR